MYGNDVTYEYVHLPAEYYNHHWVTSSECGESRGRGEQEGVRCEFLLFPTTKSTIKINRFSSFKQAPAVSIRYLDTHFKGTSLASLSSGHSLQWSVMM